MFGQTPKILEKNASSEVITAAAVTLPIFLSLYLRTRLHISLSISLHFRNIIWYSRAW